MNAIAPRPTARMFTRGWYGAGLAPLARSELFAIERQSPQSAVVDANYNTSAREGCQIVETSPPLSGVVNATTEDEFGGGPVGTAPIEFVVSHWNVTRVTHPRGEAHLSESQTHLPLLLARGVEYHTRQHHFTAGVKVLGAVNETNRLLAEIGTLLETQENQPQ